MQSRYSRIFQIVIILGDLFLLNACLLLAGALRFDEIKLRNTEYYDYYVQLMAFLNLSWLFLTFVFRTYESRINLEPRKATAKVLNTYFIHLFILLLFLVSLKKDEYSRLFLVYFYVSFLLTIMPWRFFFLRMLRSFRKKGLKFRKVALLGTEASLKRFYDNIAERPEFGIEVVGHFADSPQEGLPYLGNEQDFMLSFERTPVDEIFCAYPAGDPRFNEWFQWADENLVRYRIIPDLGLKHSKGIEIDFYSDIPVLLLRKEPLEYLHNRLLKRIFDVVCSTLVILLIFPWLVPLIALGIALDTKGPIFFRQKRTGLKDNEFSIYKFRTMRLNEEADIKQATSGDSRVTGFGAFLRRHNLDEIPQFFNVLWGNMAIVGPRPHMLAHTDEYREVIDQYMLRHMVKPGITGLSQISGLRGEHNRAEMEERVKTDVYYIENWSILLDMKIVAVTFWKTLVGDQK